MRFDSAALDESLAHWIGWFAAAPMPPAFASLVDQLEAAYIDAQQKAET